MESRNRPPDRAPKPWLQALAACLWLGFALGSVAHEQRDSSARERGGESREQRAERESARDADREAEKRDSESRDSSKGERVERGESGKSPDELREDRDDDESDQRRGGHSGGERRGHSGGGRGERLQLERDARGQERLRGELLVIARDRDLARIGSTPSGKFTVLERQALSGEDEILARVRVPRGVTIERALRDLQALLPEASIAPHHLFRPSAQTPALPLGQTGAAGAAAGAAFELGIIDTGVARATPALRQAVMRTRGFAPGGYVPRTHGTVVADIAARQGASLCSADVFGLDANNELAAPAVALASAVDWMSAEGVRVLNISIEGPDNLVLAHVIRRALGRGVAIVAAAGNDGPAAAAVYPAAYAGVIAVTAVDERGQVYRRANRGPYIQFAARGVNLPSPLAPALPPAFSGTSFAAPLVSAVLLARRSAHREEALAESLAALQGSAHDLGPPGRDDIYGWGELTSARHSFVTR